MQYYTTKEILEQRSTIPLIDVRTPAEYQTGHIPGAINMPLFTDEERVVVGTIYVKKGKDQAVEKGLEFVGPKMAGFVKQAKKLVGPDKRINIHCWRGGMRSGSMGWLMETAGMTVGVMEGGYKAYRAFIRQDFSRPMNLIVLGGMTGSGKTEILHELKKNGEQILDLESLANHKGSAFGALGQPLQPTNEMFENNTWEIWGNLNPERNVWIEDESMAIGSVWINEVLYEAMQSAKTLFLRVPFTCRAERLCQEYGHFEPDVLCELMNRIARRLGGDQVKIACEKLKEGQVDIAVNMVLKYYDKAYLYGLEHKKYLYEVVTDTGNSTSNTLLVLEKVLEMKNGL